MGGGFILQRESRHWKFTVNGDNEIVYGIGAVKGVGEGPIEAIIEAREQGGPFADLFDFSFYTNYNFFVLSVLIR